MASDTSTTRVDELFSTTWPAIGAQIAKVMDAGRKLSVYAVAVVESVPEDSACAPWAGATGTLTLGGPPVRMGLPMTILRERRRTWLPQDDGEIVSQVANMARELVKREHQHLLQVLSEAAKRVPDVATPAQLAASRGVILPADVIWNSQIAAVDAFTPELVKESLGGQFVTADLGATSPHLVVEKGSLTAYQAYSARHSRPTADSFKVELVFAARVSHRAAALRFMVA